MLYHLLYEFLYPMSAYWSPLKVFNVIQYVTFRTADASTDGSSDQPAAGAVAHPAPAGVSDRPAHSRRGPEVASGEGGHADDGRRSHCCVHRSADSSVGEPAKSLCLAG